jgi:hypothetical protein
MAFLFLPSLLLIASMVMLASVLSFLLLLSFMMWPALLLDGDGTAVDDVPSIAYVPTVACFWCC